MKMNLLTGGYFIMIKLIASDLDGTLLHGGEQSLSPRVLDLVHRLTERGVRFIAASGRQYDNERRITERLSSALFSVKT